MLRRVGHTSNVKRNACFFVFNDQLNGCSHLDTVDKANSTALSAGGYQVVPANAHHYVWSTGETVFQLDGMSPRTTTFVNPVEWTAMIKKSNS